MDSPKEREKKRKIEDQMDEGIVKKEKKESKHLYFSQNHQDSGDGDCFLNYQKGAIFHNYIFLSKFYDLS